MTVQYAHNDTVRIAYERFDGGDDPLLILGGLGRQMTWIPDGFCHALAAAGFTAVRFDNRDSGLSTHFDRHAAAGHLGSLLRRPRRPPYPAEAFADDAAAVLDANGWPAAYLVGGSMGAGTALMLAARHPHRVRSITLTTAAYVPGARVFRYMRPGVFLRLARHGLSRRGRIGGLAGETEMTVTVQRALASPHAPEPDEDAARDLGRRSHARRPYDPRAEQRQLAAGRTGNPWPFDDVPGVPIQIINGLDDPLVRAGGGLELARRLRAPIVFHPGMGHDLPPHLWPAIAADMGRC